MLDLEPIKARLAVAPVNEVLYVYAVPAYRIVDGGVKSSANGGIVIVPNTAEARDIALGRVTRMVRDSLGDEWVIGSVSLTPVPDRDIKGAGWIRESVSNTDMAVLVAEVERLREALADALPWVEAIAADLEFRSAGDEARGALERIREALS